MNNYLERFARKTYSYSKNLQMIKYPLLRFMHGEYIEI